MKFLISKLTLSKIAQFTLISGLLMIFGVSTYTSNDKLPGRKVLTVTDTTLILYKDTLFVTLPCNVVKPNKHLTIVLHLTK